MKTLIVKTGSEVDFFKRGRTLAQLADDGRPLPEVSVVSFEDPSDFLKLLTPARIALFKSIKAQPDSISAISTRLHRDRSAVKRDVDELAKAGIVEITVKSLSGHGLMKEVRAVAEQVQLEARLG